MMGERNHTFSKYCLFDSSVRVPFILSGSVIPEEKRGTIDDRPVELVDLIPTLMKLSDQPVNPILPGLDVLGEDQRLGTFSEFHGGGTQLAPTYMWRKKDWKLILYTPGYIKDAVKHVDQTKGELYDLKEDPNEWNNLYYDDGYATTREQMKTELLMHLAAAWGRGPFFYDRKGYRNLGYNIGLEGYDMWKA
jgi:arylsulfatase A-like enzyme